MPGGQFGTSGSDGDTVRVWNAITGEAKTTTTGYGNWLAPVVVSPGGEPIASSSSDNDICIRNNQIHVANTEDYASDRFEWDSRPGENGRIPNSLLYWVPCAYENDLWSRFMFSILRNQTRKTLHMAETRRNVAWERKVMVPFTSDSTALDFQSAISDCTMARLNNDISHRLINNLTTPKVLGLVRL